MILVVALFALSVSASQVFSQRTAGAQSRVEANVQNAGTEAQQEEQKLTAWGIIQMTSWLFWPFVLLTGAGIMLISYKALKEYREKVRALPLLQQSINVRDLRPLVKGIQEAKMNRVSVLMHMMISTFNKTNKAEPIGKDVDAFLNGERESFETFNRMMGFLSDSAGALGLLGTVWGIFETFHGGTLDGPTILQGMSVSLVTTLVGLIISLGLNAGTTTVFTLFNRQLGLIATRCEELRQALLFVENRQAQSQPVRATPGGQPAAQRPRPAARPQPSPRPQPEHTYQPPAGIRRKQPAMDDVFETRPVTAATELQENGWI